MTEAASPAVWGLAFGAGLVSLLSPCVLALVPAYLGYLSGAARPGAAGARGRLVGRSLLFVLGFSIVFVLLGASATALGRQLWANRTLLRQIAGALVVLLGLHQLGLLRWQWLDVERRVLSRLPGSAGAGPGGQVASGRRWLGRLARGPWGALLVGMAFAAGWSPCVGPVLASILLMAGTAGTVGAGVLLLSLYAAGMAVPFLLMAGLMDRGAARLARWLTRHGAWVERASGALLILIGVALYTNFFLKLPGYLNYYRWLGL